MSILAMTPTTCASSTTIADVLLVEDLLHLRERVVEPHHAVHRLRRLHDVAVGGALARDHALEQVDLVDDHHGLRRVTRIDRHLRDAHVRHALRDRGDGLVPARELDAAPA